MADRRKVLVVDDSPSVVKVLRFLMTREGYEVHEAHDGVQGLAVTRRERPDVVILDVMMPQMDGFSVLRAIREDPAIRDTVVIVLSAKGQEQDRVKALELRADEFWTKPFSPSHLTRRLREIFVQRGGSGSGDVTKDAGGRAPATAGGGPPRLTDQEGT
jgi:DNA-binding response OmpR family regulator